MYLYGVVIDNVGKWGLKQLMAGNGKGMGELVNSGAQLVNLDTDVFIVGEGGFE